MRPGFMSAGGFVCVGGFECGCWRTTVERMRKALSVDLLIGENTGWIFDPNVL